MNEEIVPRGEIRESPEPSKVSAQARYMAERHMKKYKKEIDRLKQHAEDCLITNNKDGYIYAIDKLRQLTFKKKLDYKTMESLYITSKEKVDEIIRLHMK